MLKGWETGLTNDDLNDLTQQAGVKIDIGVAKPLVKHTGRSVTTQKAGRANLYRFEDATA